MKALARKLRKKSTDAESLLWMHLRSRRMAGCKFRRQVVIGPYIVDFACFDAGLVIEADGGQHLEQQDKDDERAAFLESRGYQVMRFWNDEILCDIESVLEKIHAFLIDIPSPQPSPGGRGSK